MRITEQDAMLYLEGSRLRRKAKKFFLGKKVTRSRLRRMIARSIVVEHRYPTAATVLPKEFCPECGCTAMHSSGNMTSYPEVWINYSCARCGATVGEEDNSPFEHRLIDLIPEERTVRCSDACPCRRDSSPDEVYWNETVPKEFMQATGIRMP